MAKLDKPRYFGLAAAWKGGDLLYGVLTDRAEAMRALVLARSTKTDDRYMRGGDGYAREVPEFAGKARPIYVQSDLSNAVWSYGSSYNSDEDLQKTLTGWKRAKSFRAFLTSHRRYNVAREAGRDIAAELDKEVTEEFKRLRWGRLEKAGIEFQLSQGRSVHVLFGELFKSIRDIANKEGELGRSAVARDLRWIYRHRAIPEIAARKLVRFWTATREVPLNEVFSNVSWRSYQPTNTYASLGAAKAVMKRRSVPRAVPRPASPGGGPPFSRPSSPGGGHPFSGRASVASASEEEEWMGPSDVNVLLDDGPEFTNSAWRSETRSGSRWNSQTGSWETHIPPALARAIEGLDVSYESAVRGPANLWDGQHSSPIEFWMARQQSKWGAERKALPDSGDAATLRRATLRVVKQVCAGWWPESPEQGELVRRRILATFHQLDDEFEWEDLDGIDVD